MAFSASRKIVLAVAAALLLLAGFAIVRKFSSGNDANARQQILQFVPGDATSVIFVDLDQLRASPFLAKLYSWAPQPPEDSEYAQFVRETGFSYERDLHQAVFAVSNHGPSTNLLAIADGNFDRKKMEDFLNRNGQAEQKGKWKVFRLNAAANEKILSIAFLSEHRIAIADSEPSAALAATLDNPSHAEWNERFERLTGTPVFAVIRQDPAVQSALADMAPGGFRSLQLAALLTQLQWISIAGKPDGDQLRVIADGECLSETSNSQLDEFLKGIALLAQNGLNDPKLRQQMDPAERSAYLEVLKSADIQKINRGEWKSVRVALSLTPQFLEVAGGNQSGKPSSGSEGPAPKASSGKPKQKK